MTDGRFAVLAMNLGGPADASETYPFLLSLFSDPSVLRTPRFVRFFLARLIARRRAPVAQAIYDSIGGGSPILAQTEAQARALETRLRASGADARVFVAMRHARPKTDEALREARAFSDEIVFAPLYPQYSTVTTGSSVKACADAFRVWNVPPACVCDWPDDAGFIQAYAEAARAAKETETRAVAWRWLFSAHGLPESIAKFDPYPQRTEETAKALAHALGLRDEDWRLCWQSRVGPVRWLRPSLEECVAEAAREGFAPLVVPISFVSEHSETLAELDKETRAFAQSQGAPAYARARAPGVDAGFIDALAARVLAARGEPAPCWRAPRAPCPRAVAKTRVA